MITDGWSTYEVRLSRVYTFRIKRKMYGPRWRSDISSSFIRTGLSRSPKQNSSGNSVKSTIDDLRLQAKCQRTFHVSIHLTRAQKQTCKARKSRSSHPHSIKKPRLRVADPFAQTDTAVRWLFSLPYATLRFSLSTQRWRGLGWWAWDWPCAEKHELIVLKWDTFSIRELSTKVKTQLAEKGIIFYSSQTLALMTYFSATFRKQAQTSSFMR